MLSDPLIIAICVCGVVIVVPVLRRLRRWFRRTDGLDAVIARFSSKDVFRVRDLLKSVAGFGATGSGKTSAVVRWLARGIISHFRCTLLILCSKPEDKQQWEDYFSAAGRRNELLIFEPGGPWRFNAVDYILKTGGDYRDVTRFLMAVNETLRSGDGGGKEEFWEQQQERTIYNAVVLLMLATGKVSAPELQRFLSGAATKREDLHKDEWKTGFHNRVLAAAYDAPKTELQSADFRIAFDYFVNEWPGMNNETRSSIAALCFGLLHAMCTGHARLLFSTDTNVTPDDMLAGKSVLVNVSPTEHGATGRIANATLKWATQFCILRRAAKPGDYVNVIVCDEAQLFVNTPDVDYLAQCRSHLGCMIFFTQSKPSYYAAMGGERQKHRVDALLANFNLKIICSLGDVETAHWASQLVGRGLQMRFSGGGGQQDDMWETLTGKGKSSAGFSMHMDNVLEPNVFMHGMRTGGKENRYLVDAVAVKTAEPFADGANFKWVTFSQR